jgi:hypothetical protein
VVRLVELDGEVRPSLRIGDQEVEVRPERVAVLLAGQSTSVDVESVRNARLRKDPNAIPFGCVSESRVCRDLADVDEQGLSTIYRRRL